MEVELFNLEAILSDITYVVQLTRQSEPHLDEMKERL